MIATTAAMTVGALLGAGAQSLRAAGIERPYAEATLLASYALEYPTVGAGSCPPLRDKRSAIMAHPERPIEDDQAAKFLALVERRANHEPMAHIVGECEFYGRAFLTDPRALIPRPETELLVETAVELLRDGPPDPLVVDVGTGTGCIGITLLLETPARVVLSDVSYAALQLARLNLSRYGLTDRVQLMRGDLLSWLNSPADLVVANLPYIPSEAFLDLSPDVRDYEPRLALDGGPGGTKLLLELLRQASACQVGALLAELDPRQADILSIAARRMFPDRPIHVLPDLAGHRRLLRVGWPT